MLFKARSRVAELRERAGLTQAQLAVFIGVSTDTIKNWERYDGLYRLEKYLKLCDVLGCELPDLIDYTRCSEEEESPSVSIDEPLELDRHQQTDVKHASKQLPKDDGELFERRDPHNIRKRLAYDLRSTFINSAFDHFEEKFSTQLNFQSKRKSIKFQKAIESSLVKKDSSNNIIPKYKFFDKEGNSCNHIQVAEKIIETIRNNYSKYERHEMTIRHIIDEIANYICYNYELRNYSRKPTMLVR